MSQSNEINAPTDSLSATGRRLLRFETADAYEQLTVTGQGNLDARAILDSTRPADLIAAPVADADAAACVLAGLWIWHGWIDMAHPIVQDIRQPIGSVWHAIIHRLEGDFSNSRYWYGRAGTLPIDTAIASNVARLVDPLPADKQLLALTRNGWNPDAFITLVQQVHQQPTDPRYRICVQIQQIEWRLLFDYCVRQSV